MNKLKELTNLYWIDYIYYILTEPSRLYYYLQDRNKKFISYSLIIPCLVAMIDILCMSVVFKQSTFFYTKVSYGWILLSLTYILGALFLSVCIDVIFQFMGYKGNARQIFTIVNMAHFPRVFMLPAIFIIQFVGFVPFFWFFLMALFLGIWCIFVLVKSISEMHSISFSSALLIVLAPYFVLFILVLIIMFLFGILLHGFFTT